MRLAVSLLVGGLCAFACVLGARWLNARAWRRTLMAFRLHLPANLTVEDVAGWLAGVSALTNPPRWSLVPMPPLCLEVVADARGIRHYLLVSAGAQHRVLAGLRAALPGVRVTADPEFVATRPSYRLATEATLTSRRRPLAAERAEAANAALLSALQPVGSRCEARIQFILTGAGTPQAVASASARSDSPSIPWWLESSAPSDADAVRAERNKLKEPLLVATLRLGIGAPTRAEAYKMLSRVWPAFHSTNNPGVRVVRRWLPSGVVTRHMAQRKLPITRWPLLLNAAEAVAFCSLPLGGIALPGLALGMARQLPPTPTLPTRGTVLAVSDYAGSEGQPLALSPNDRLKHLFCLGPTGSGKSWLLAQLILQDIAKGHGVFVIDVKGDLVTDVLDRVRDQDAERVVVLDAGKRDLPIGFNVLGGAHSEEARELAVDNILHIFREMFSAFWGPRSDSVMRAALNTLVHAVAPDGSAYTLCEIVPLLHQPAFRRSVLASTAMPDTLRSFWQWYQGLSDGELRQVTAPVVNKIEAFTSRTPIRLMLGQATGLDLNTIFTQRRVVLVNLAKGTLGSETAALLGSLLLSKLWMTTLARISVPAKQRRPAFAYLDEMQDIIRLPLSLSEILAQARGLGLGITLATQFAAQLPETLRAAVLGTVGSLVTFAVDHDDARLLAKRFAPLTAEDLQGLGRYSIALRPTVNGERLTPVTGTTLPLAAPSRDGAELAAASRQRYGVPRAEVEAAMHARLTATAHRRRDNRIEREAQP